MKHAPPHRCRLCTANDRDALVAEVAEQLWQSVAEGSPDGWPWDEAGYWRDVYLGIADRAMRALER